MSTPSGKPKTRTKNTAKKPGSSDKSARNWLRIFWMLFALGVTIVFFWMVYLNAKISVGISGQLFAEPARVYARPMTIYPGLGLTPEQLVNELDRLGYRPEMVVSDQGEYARTGNSIELQTRAYDHWDGHQPSRHLMIDFTNDRVGLVVNMQTGQDEWMVRLDPLLIGSLFPGQSEDRILLSMQQVPDSFRLGLLAVEDRRYYDHWGISPAGILRALMANMGSGGISQGGSTLTQQLVKNYFLTPEQTLWRKINEALMALLLEFHFSKDQILEAYMNEVYLAQDGARAIHGFGLASMEFFGAPLEELSIADQALLIGMVKGPSLYNPFRNPDRARARRDLVLSVMAEQGVISLDEARRELSRPVYVRQGITRTRYPAFLDQVKRELNEQIPGHQLNSAGLNIFTTLDPRMQTLTESQVQQRLSDLEAGYQIPEDTLQAAVVLTQPESGEILAMVGDRHPRTNGYNRALDANRPVGSLLKPAIYLTALEQGYTLATPLNDSPVVVEGRDGSRWEPKNFDQKNHGKPILVNALTSSYNQTAARLGMEVGLTKVLARLSSLGINKQLPVYPSVLLGATGLSPMDIASMYGTLAANGSYTPPRSIRAVTDSQFNPVLVYELAYTQVIDPVSMYLIQYGLEQVMLRGTGAYAGRSMPSEWRLAGKTGTTDDQRDSWFAGYSNDFLAVVWVGRDDNQPVPLTGSSGALRVWASLMRDLNPRVYEAREPLGIEWKWINPEFGSQSKQGCQGAMLLPFAEGTGPVNRPGCQVETNSSGDIVDDGSGWLNRLLGR